MLIDRKADTDAGARVLDDAVRVVCAIRLGLRHFNRLVEHCCKEALGSEHAVRVVEAALGQGLVPTIRTVYLILEAAARDGDYASAERVLQVAKAYALRADTR